ncbi:MAG: DUF1211 domain-containing protein [Sphingobacteriaceae bacterium]|nr:MAG: DUF1211 domain-containing protein [Sphingobacteriaceae bacterium]
MHKTQLEAFSDGVIAIIITITVLEFKVTHGDRLNAITALLPVFSSYVLMKQAGKQSKITKAFGKDWKGKASVLIYLLAIGAAFINPKLSLILYGAVALLWFIPDRRIERTLPGQNLAG